MGNVVDIQANNLLAYMVEDELPLKQQSLVSLFWHPKTLLHIKACGDWVFQKGAAEHQQGAATIENSCFWMVDQEIC